MIRENKIVFCSLLANFLINESFQSLVVKINCRLYLGEDYSVDSERSEMFVKILRRVGEMLEGDWSVDRGVGIYFNSIFMF